MGIVDYDSNHKLYLASMLEDGRFGASYQGQEAGFTHGSDGRRLHGAGEWRPLTDVSTFAVVCDCSSPLDYTVRSTVLARWERVAIPMDEDLEFGRIYVDPDDSALDAGGRPEVQEQMRWHWLKHLAPQRTTRDLEVAWMQSRTALAAVDAAVKAGREAGLSWADVGRATGMSRQAARQRWGAMPFDDPAYDPLDPGPEPIRDTFVSAQPGIDEGTAVRLDQAHEDDHQARLDEQQWREDHDR